MHDRVALVTGSSRGTDQSMSTAACILAREATSIIGADVIAGAIAARGLQRVLVFPGRYDCTYFDRLRMRGIETFCARHEQGAAYAALAAARLLGEPQVVMVTSGAAS